MPKSPTVRQSNTSKRNASKASLSRYRLKEPRRLGRKRRK